MTDKEMEDIFKGVLHSIKKNEIDFSMEVITGSSSPIEAPLGMGYIHNYTVTYKFGSCLIPSVVPDDKMHEFLHFIASPDNLAKLLTARAEAWANQPLPKRIFEPPAGGFPFKKKAKKRK